MVKVEVDKPVVEANYTITLSESELIDLMKWYGHRPLDGPAASRLDDSPYSDLSDALQSNGVPFKNYYDPSYKVTVTGGN